MCVCVCNIYTILQRPFWTLLKECFNSIKARLDSKDICAHARTLRAVLLQDKVLPELYYGKNPAGMNIAEYCRLPAKSCKNISEYCRVFPARILQECCRLPARILQEYCRLPARILQNVAGLIPARIVQEYCGILQNTAEYCRLPSRICKDLACSIAAR